MQRRFHKRGRRSELAVLRRSLPKRCRTLPGVVPGETGTSMPDPVLNSNPHQSNIIHNESNSRCRHFGSSVGPNDVARDTKQRIKQDLLIYVQNIRCLKANLAELTHHLQQYQPHLVLLQETWLDASTEEVSITGYRLVSRRDRASNANRGGVITYAREDFNNIAHIGNYASDERSWHFNSLDAETILIANWYRPP